MSWGPRMSDAQREEAIARARQRVLTCTEAKDTRTHYREMRRLMRQRSPSQRRRMEGSA